MNNLTIRNARLIMKNFSGKKTDYTPEGVRQFGVLIDDEEYANALMNDGWNVKPLRKRDENDPQHYFLKVAVFFGAYPPNIIQISGNNRINLDESMVGSLDWAEIEKVDLTIRPRTYTVAGRSGIKAYLKTMVVTTVVDELLEEYANIGENHFEEEGDPPF